MENASNALLLAAGVLIGVLILSLMVYLFIDFGSTSAEINSQITEQQLLQFNSKFTSYEGQEELTIYDVITVASYANENNIYYKDNLDNYKIIIYLANPSTSQIQDNIENIKLSLIENDKNLLSATNLNLPTYSCKVLSYYPNGRVHEVKFTKK